MKFKEALNLAEKNSSIVKPVLFVCPLFREPGKFAKITGGELSGTFKDAWEPLILNRSLNCFRFVFYFFFNLSGKVK